MKTIQKLLSNAKVKMVLMAGGFMFAAALVFGGYGASYNVQTQTYAVSQNTVYAACPDVPADCTIDDVIGDSVSTLSDTVLSTLTSNLPVVLGLAAIVMIAFAVIKLAFRWARKFIH